MAKNCKDTLMYERQNKNILRVYWISRFNLFTDQIFQMTNKLEEVNCQIINLPSNYNMKSIEQADGHNASIRYPCLDLETKKITYFNK